MSRMKKEKEKNKIPSHSKTPFEESHFSLESNNIYFASK